MNKTLTENYSENVTLMQSALRVNESFDVLYKKLTIGSGELSFFYIDGFTKDTVMQKLMMHFLSVKKLPSSAREFMISNVPYVECDVTEDADLMIRSEERRVGKECSG